MVQKNALSRRQFKENEFDSSGYEYNLRSGEFVATIDCKRWGKRKKLVTYMTFEDGRRIVAPTWPRSRYEGLANMEVGSKIRIIYIESSRGNLCVRGRFSWKIGEMIIISYLKQSKIVEYLFVIVQFLLFF